MTTPLTVLDAFRDAIQSGERWRAQRNSTELGWASKGDSARRLYSQGRRSNLLLLPLGDPEIRDDRAVLQISMYWPERSTFIGGLWLLMVREDAQWKLEGANRSESFAGLFLEGRIPAILRRDALPESHDGLRWAMDEIARIQDDVLRSPAEVHAAWRLPELGAIPTYDVGRERRPALLDRTGDDPVVLAHRTLRDRIRSVHSGTFLAIASTVSAEGKSTVAANLAIGYAVEGKRVLLVDVDLRVPRISRRFEDIEPRPGLTEVLRGFDADNAIQRTNIEGLDVLVAGTAPRDPVAPLGSEEMRALFRHLEPKYDLILLDTTPAVEFDDPMILSKCIDADVSMVLVVETGKTRRSMLDITRHKFAEAGIRPIGMVINRAAEVPAEGPTAMKAELIRTAEISDLGRIAVGLRFSRASDGYERDRWTVLQRDERTGVLTEVSKQSVLSVETLLAGVEIGWDGTGSVANLLREFIEGASDVAAQL